MRKIAKLSLVAAVAVAGLTTANAGSLENMIKNVDAFGYANLRYNSYDNDGTNDQNVYHKVVLGISSKINDDFSYTYAGAITNRTGTTSTTAGTMDYADGNMHTVYTYFTYTGIPGVTTMIGQQGIPTVFTDLVDTYGDTQEGTGIVLAGNAGPVNLAVAHYKNTNLSTGGASIVKGTTTTASLASVIDPADLTAVIASTKIGGVSLDATYIDLEDVADGYSVGAKGSIDLGAAKVAPFARYTSTDLTDAGITADQALWYVGTTFKAGMFGGKLAYGETDKDGGFVAFDNDAEAAFLGWNLSMNGYADAEMLQAQLNANVTSKINVAVQHNTLEAGTTVDDEETFMTVTYKPSKNFTAYVRGGVDEISGVDHTRGRIQLTYTF